MDDVTFSHNDGAESTDHVVWLSSSVGGTGDGRAARMGGGAKSATFDCLVYWFLIRNFQQEALLPQRDRATCYVSQFVLFSRGMEVTKVPNSKSDLQLQGHSRALAMVPFDRPHTIFC